MADVISLSRGLWRCAVSASLGTPGKESAKVKTPPEGYHVYESTGTCTEFLPHATDFLPQSCDIYENTGTCGVSCEMAGLKRKILEAGHERGRANQKMKDDPTMSMKTKEERSGILIDPTML